MTRPGGTWQNWARTEAVRPQFVERPATLGAVQRSVASALRRDLRIKAVGAGHSFTGIAVAPGVLLELERLTGLVSVDEKSKRATLLAGTRLYDVPRLLRPYGLAMQNLGDIDRQSLSGAISTGTHGTGAQFGGIATQVVGARLVTGTGELLTVSETENADLLPAVALGLGALGILVEVTLQCVPAFVLHAVEKPEALGEVLADLDDRVAAADHFEMYWFPHTDRAMTKTNTRLPESAVRHPLTPTSRFVDDVVIGGGVHRLACVVGRIAPPLVPSINRLSVRVWGDREFTDASDRVFATSRGVRFREMEYALPMEHVVPALEEVQALIKRRGWRIEFPLEVRFAAADDVWLSTAYQRATGYIAVHRYWRSDPTAYFADVERIMLEHGGRPHWGKMHTQDAAALRESYPRFDDFVAARARLDPEGRFRNDYLDRVLGQDPPGRM